MIELLDADAYIEIGYDGKGNWTLHSHVVRGNSRNQSLKVFQEASIQSRRWMIWRDNYEFGQCRNSSRK